MSALRKMSRTALVGRPGSTCRIIRSRLDIKSLVHISNSVTLHCNLRDPFLHSRDVRSSNTALNPHHPTKKASFPDLQLDLLRRAKFSTLVPKLLPRRNVQLVLWLQGLREGDTSVLAESIGQLTVC